MDTSENKDDRIRSAVTCLCSEHTLPHCSLRDEHQQQLGPQRYPGVILVCDAPAGRDQCSSAGAGSRPRPRASSPAEAPAWSTAV